MAFFVIEIKIDKIFLVTIQNYAVAMAVFGIPVVASLAITWCAFALAGFRAPVVVCWAYLRAANTGAKNVTKDETIFAWAWFALASTLFGVEIFSSSAGIEHVALTSAGLGVPVVVDATITLRSTDAATNSGVEVMSRWAIMGLTKACAQFDVKVLTSWAVTFSADAKAVFLTPFLSLLAALWFALASAVTIVPELSVVTLLNEAFTFACLEVPGVALITRLRRADALACSGVPDVVCRTFVLINAVAFAVVEVPELIGVWAIALNTATFAGNRVELMVLVFTLTHFVPARAVVVLVIPGSVDKLAFGAHNQSCFLRLAISILINPVYTWLKHSRNDSSVVLGFHLDKSVSILENLSFKG